MIIEKIFRNQSPLRMLQTWRGSSPQPPDHKLDAHPTEPLRPAITMFEAEPFQPCKLHEKFSNSVHLDMMARNNLIRIHTFSSICSCLIALSTVKDIAYFKDGMVQIRN